MSSSYLEKKSLDAPVFTLKHKLLRALWSLFYVVFIRFSPIPLFKYRSFLLKLWGASIDYKARVYPSAIIWWPANLTLKPGATIGPQVKIYNQGAISIGADAILSQGAYICASTHDYTVPLHPLILAPITIEKHAWICADAFIGPGVVVGEGAVVGARSAVFKNVEQWAVYGGNPANYIKSRGDKNLWQ